MPAAKDMTRLSFTGRFRLGGCFGSSPVHATNNATAVSQQEQPEEPAHPAMLAFKSNSLAVSFSGGGFMLPYFVGVLRVLRDVGIIRPGTQVAGSSSGSLMAASIGSGLTPDEIMSSFMESVHDVRKHGVSGRLHDAVRRQLQGALPPDAHKRCSGTTTVCVTTINFVKLRPRLIHEFHSREDLIAALLASCHIPRIFNGDLTTHFRGVRVCDGGAAAFIPHPHTHVHAHRHRPHTATAHRPDAPDHLPHHHVPQHAGHHHTHTHRHHPRPSAAGAGAGADQQQQQQGPEAAGQHHAPALTPALASLEDHHYKAVVERDLPPVPGVPEPHPAAATAAAAAAIAEAVDVHAAAAAAALPRGGAGGAGELAAVETLLPPPPLEEERPASAVSVSGASPMAASELDEGSGCETLGGDTEPSSPTAGAPFLLKVSCFPMHVVQRLPLLNRKAALHQLDLGIWPGCSGGERWPYSIKQLVSCALAPGPDEWLQLLLEAGQADAVRWAASAGFLKVPASELAEGVAVTEGAVPVAAAVVAARAS